MGKLEAVIFIAVIFIAMGGLYLAYSGTGQAIRKLPGCSGGYVIPYLGVSSMSASQAHDFQFRGLRGSVELVSVKERKAMFRVNGVSTPYIGLGEFWIGDEIGVKVGEINSRSVGVCLASGVPECVDYYWDLDSRQRECGRWTTQADELF